MGKGNGGGTFVFTTSLHPTDGTREKSLVSPEDSLFDPEELLYLSPKPFLSPGTTAILPGINQKSCLWQGSVMRIEAAALTHSPPLN